MNPKEFNWTESQQITVTNPTAELFTWQVHGKKYELAAGQSASMPGYLAWLYVYGQACKKAQAAGMWNRWNEEEIRKEYYEKFVAGVQPIMQSIEVEKSLVQAVDDGDSSDDQSGSSSTDEINTPPIRGRRGRPASV